MFALVTTWLRMIQAMASFVLFISKYFVARCLCETSSCLSASPNGLTSTDLDLLFQSHHYLLITKSKCQHFFFFQWPNNQLKSTQPPQLPWCNAPHYTEQQLRSCGMYLLGLCGLSRVFLNLFYWRTFPSTAGIENILLLRSESTHRWHASWPFALTCSG